MSDRLKLLLNPDVQVGCALFVIGSSLLALVSVLLRFTFAARLSIGRTEPFWVLLLSVGALLYAGFSALPAALAYREVKP